TIMAPRMTRCRPFTSRIREPERSGRTPSLGALWSEPGGLIEDNGVHAVDDLVDSLFDAGPERQSHEVVPHPVGHGQIAGRAPESSASRCAVEGNVVENGIDSDCLQCGNDVLADLQRWQEEVIHVRIV